MNLGSSARLCLAGFDEAKQNPQLSFRPLFPKRNSGLFAEEAISCAECMLIGVCSQPRILSPPFSTGFHFLFSTTGGFVCSHTASRHVSYTPPPSNHLVALRASYLARLWRAGFKQFIITLRVVKSTPVALVKLRGGAVKSSPLGLVKSLCCAKWWWWKTIPRAACICLHGGIEK